MKWPQLLAALVTHELALDNWRERLRRVEAAEVAHFGGLPYVTGLAVIGSVGRGNPWPVSDLDLLVVADCWKGKDPEELIHAEEERRNKRLHAARIVNDVEAGDWVLLSQDVTGAASADDDAFFLTLAHPHWLGIAIKAHGARVV